MKEKENKGDFATAMSTATSPSAPSALRRSCTFCRARKIRCSGGHICTACRKRNINCIYDLEARKGRPRRVSQARRHWPSSSPETDPPGGDSRIEIPVKIMEEASQQKQEAAPPPVQDQMLGEELEQMFDEYFIRKSGSRSNLFQNSIASFHRHMQQQQQQPLPSRNAVTQQKNRRSILSYDGLLSFLAHEMVEILLLRFGYLGCECPDTGQQNFYITSLAADTAPTMFDLPRRVSNPIDALGKHRVMQLVDVWFFMHPLSPLVSKTLLLSGITDGTVDESLLAVSLADACEVFCEFSTGVVPTSGGDAGDDSDDGRDDGDNDNDEHDPQTLAQFAAAQLKYRPLPLPEATTLTTAQALILLGWRELSRGHARRGTCYVGYTCRIVARQHQQWVKGGGQKNSMKLNGVDIAEVEKEILQNIYWLCLSSTTWSFMQIDQPFSLLVPDEFPDFPSLDETKLAVLRLDRASGNISTLPSQIQTMRWLWPLSHITSTVAHIYTLYLNAPTEDRKIQAAPWHTRHIHQLHHLLRSRFDSSTLSLEIRDILLQAIQVVEREVTTPSSQSFLLTAYHAIIVHMLFSSPEWRSSPSPTAPSTMHAICESTTALLDISERFVTVLPTGLVPTQRTFSVNTLVLAFDACSRALVHICREWEQQGMDGLNNSSSNNNTGLIREKLVGLSERLRKACKADVVSQYASVMRIVKKRVKQVHLAFQSLGDSSSSTVHPTYASSLSLDGDHLPFAVDQSNNGLLGLSSSSASLSNLMTPPSLAFGYQSASPEIVDPGFFVSDPSWGSLLGFPGFTRKATGTADLPEDLTMSLFPLENDDNNNNTTNIFPYGQGSVTDHCDTLLQTNSGPFGSSSHPRANAGPWS